MSNQELATRQESAMAPAAAEPAFEPVFTPQADIVEDVDKIVVQLDLPGVDAGDTQILYENGVLSVHGKAPKRQPGEERYRLQEYRVGNYYRQFKLGETVDASRISAESKDGVLTLTLPKVEAARPRRIEVRAK